MQWPQTNYALRLITYLLINRDFPLTRSAWPIYFITMNEWKVGQECVHIICRSHYTNSITKWLSNSANQSTVYWQWLIKDSTLFFIFMCVNCYEGGVSGYYLTLGCWASSHICRHTNMNIHQKLKVHEVEKDYLRSSEELCTPVHQLNLNCSFYC